MNPDDAVLVCVLGHGCELDEPCREMCEKEGGRP